MKKILVTGSAGFIGSSVTIEFLNRGYSVVGIDNHNDYYDPNLKKARLKRFAKNENYEHYQKDLANEAEIWKIFNYFKPDIVVNLAAQAGVRFSIDNPKAYIASNLVGFANILELCKQFSVEHLVYASSSSVYGANNNMPFAVNQNVDHPLSLYAATKKSNELMAHSYASLFNLPCTGLRFFTVYGPWGRPDMALFKFTESILKDEVIKVYNYGCHKRDFTYIDDIVYAISELIKKPAKNNPNWDDKNPDPGSSKYPWRIYNIGSNNPIKLIDFIKTIEKVLNKSAKLEYLPLQPGDVPNTFANIDDLQKEINFKPSTSIFDGVSEFVKWYINFIK